MAREHRGLYSALAPLIGALITLMSGVNSRFSAVVGTLTATLVIHIAGLLAISAILLVRREEARPGRLPFYYYLGGFVGVGTVFSTIYAFSTLGASLAVALALLGQTFFAVTADATGFMGRARYPLTVRRLPGIVLAVAGVAIMCVGRAGKGNAALPAMLVALVAGAIPGLSFILNSELGRRKGILRSTRVNYIVGLATTLAVVLVVRPHAAEAARAVAAAGPFLALGGGFMGVAVVTSMNFIFPRMAAFSATLLLFSGQAFSGVLIDFVTDGVFDARKLIGACVVLAGLAVNALLSASQPAGPAVGRA
jgi:bacterial/archaeal transporter family-2 protein